MIREELALTLTHIRLSENWTYEDMMKKTGLNKTQLNRIIKNNGEGVSIDLMETVLIKLGYIVEIEVI